MDAEVRREEIIRRAIRRQKPVRRETSRPAGGRGVAGAPKKRLESAVRTSGRTPSTRKGPCYDRAHVNVL